MLRRLVHRWEHAIFATDAGDRRPQPFGWGLSDVADLVDGHGDLLQLAEHWAGASEDFYRVGAMTGADFDGERLTFDSPLPAADPEVSRAAARLFEAPAAGGRAVVVIPQWNADEGSMVAACRILNRCGLSALRITLPYHEQRRPARMLRADAMVSPVLGLTLQSVRRAVLEVRLAVAWLKRQGYRHVGLFGTSLGSCIGFLALSHDEGVRAAAFNHVAGHFADVVWEGLATRHVRASLDPHVDLSTLRRCWAPISPAHFAPRLASRQPPMLMVSGAYDPIFLPQHAASLVDALRAAGVEFRRVVLPCGHYTLGRPPFYLIDAWMIIRFFRRHLR
jgi:pimeloyl-ACP methyl ester carboxylesterase